MMRYTLPVVAIAEVEVVTHAENGSRGPGGAQEGWLQAIVLAVADEDQSAIAGSCNPPNGVGGISAVKEWSVPSVPYFPVLYFPKCLNAILSQAISE